LYLGKVTTGDPGETPQKLQDSRPSKLYLGKATARDPGETSQKQQDSRGSKTSP